MSSPEVRARLSSAKKGRAPWNKGKKLSKEQCQAMSERLKGKPAWNKGKSNYWAKAEKNCNWKGGPPHCIDCNKLLANRKAKRCHPCSAKNNRGPLHYKWKGNQTEVQIVRSSAEYKKWHREVLKRDFYRCRSCGAKPKKLEVHHIVPFKESKELRMEVQNGITLCHDCHNETRGRELDFLPKFFALLVLPHKFISNV